MTAWTLSCPDWESRIREGRSLIPDLPLNEPLAQRAVAIFDRLRLADVPDNPTLADAAGPWARDIIRAAFGSWDPVTLQRYIRLIFGLVGKKNAKTTYIGAGGSLVWILMNERPLAKGILVAPTHDITEIAYNQVEGMIRLDSALRDRLRIQNHIKKITNVRTGASLQIMSFDPDVLTGQKPSFWMLDELHIISKSPKARSALGQLRGGMISQPEAFGIIISTMSETAPSGVFKSELDQARAIRDGRATGRTLPVLYEFPRAIAKDKAAWRDPANWPMVVPNNGRSITVERLIEEYAEAEKSGEQELRRWASQHLNVEIGLALGSDSWPGADFWERRTMKSLTLETLLERCEVATIGIDGGGLDDLFGMCVLGRDKVTKRWLSWCHAWAHRVVLLRRKGEAAKLLDFEKAGELTLFGSDEEAEAIVGSADDGEDAFELQAPQDIAGIIEIAKKVDDAGILASVGLDPAGVGAVVDALAEIGIGGEGDSAEKTRVVGVSQGWKLMSAIKTVERKLSDGTFGHCDQALMNWCVGNAKVEPKGNAMLITKQVSGSAKIDPLMALFDAAALMSTNPEAMGGSIWDRPELEASLAR